MTTLAPEAPPVEQDTDGDGLAHYVCVCQVAGEPVALCGFRFPPGAVERASADTDLVCVVCADIDRVGCPRCGV